MSRPPSDNRGHPVRPPGSSDRMYVDREYLLELHQKALLWDQQQQQQAQQQQLVSQIASMVSSAVSPPGLAANSRMDQPSSQLMAQIASMVSQATSIPTTGPATRTSSPVRKQAVTPEPVPGRGKFLPDPDVPLDRTLVIRQLPNDMRNHEVAHSVLAPGGLRYLRLYKPAQAYHGDKGAVAIVTFVTPEAAQGYMDYVAENGYYLSRRVKPGHPKVEEGESVIESVDSKYWHLLKHLPYVQVRWFTGTEGYIKAVTDGDFCNVDAVIRKEGATRVLRITAEEDEIRADLKMLMIDPHPLNNIESVSCSTNKQIKVCLLRFYSIRDSIVVKRFFDLMKKYDRVITGKTVDYHKDPFDRPTEMLGWDALEKTKLRSPNASPQVSLTTSPTLSARPPAISTDVPFKSAYAGAREEHFEFNPMLLNPALIQTQPEHHHNGATNALLTSRMVDR